MANTKKKIHTKHTARASARGTQQTRNGNRNRHGAVAVVDGGNVNDKNRTECTKIIGFSSSRRLQQLNEKQTKNIPIFVTNTHPREQTIKTEEKYTVENPS